MDNRKNWTARQDQLRKALSSKSRFEDALALFLEQHAAVHTAAISEGQAWSLHDEVLEGLNVSQVKKVPRPGQNSIAWLLWHITRIEDMTINILTLGQPQIWTPAWAEKLVFPRPDCGAGMDEKDVAELSDQINVPALLDYRAAVGRRTRDSLSGLDADRAREIVPNATVQVLEQQGSIGPRAHWLYEYYTNRTRAFFLTRTATSHNFIHLNEVGRVGKKLAA